MIDPKVSATTESADGKYKVTLHTTQHYYVVQGFTKGHRQFYERTTVFARAKTYFRELCKTRWPGKEIDAPEAI